MAIFPVLKTGAVMQYPVVATVRYSNQLIQFVDGFEQRYRDYATPMHEWVIRLELLDEAEVRSLEQFFTDQDGQFESFVFVDPNDNVTYPDCSLLIDDMDVTVDGERRCRTSVVVRENRN